MTSLNAEVTCTYEIHETLISLRMKERNPAYGLKFTGVDEEALPTCYYCLRLQIDEGVEEDHTIPWQRVLEIGRAIRRRIINFIISAVDHFGEDREIAFVAIDYLDRFLLTRMRHDNENILPMSSSTLRLHGIKMFDLYVLASLGLALKLFSPCSGCPQRGEERNRVDNTINNNKIWYHSSNNHYFFLPSTKLKTSVYNGHGYSTFVAFTGGDKHIVEGISTAESDILTTLEWYLHPPTSYRFIHTVFQFVPPGLDTLWESLRNFAYFQAELALSNNITNSFSPSVIATCAVSNSIHRHMLCQLTLNKGEEVNQDHVIKETLKTILKQMETSLQISSEFDKRIIALKSFLTNQSVNIWQESMNVIDMKENCQRNTKCKRTSPQESQFPTLPWDHCFSLENLEIFFPTSPKPHPVASSNTLHRRDIVHKLMKSNALENHYNKYIRPKLYRVNYMAQSMNSGEKI